MGLARVVRARNGNYYWRVLATGFAFGLFGAGALVLGAVVVPCMALFVRDPARRARRVRRVVHHAFRVFIGLLTLLGLLTSEVHGREILKRPGLLLVANHPSLLDVVFLVSLVGDAVCVVKDSLFHNPWMGFIVRAAGYISNASPGASIDACVAALHGGASTIIFPEGTRTPPGAARRLQRGAAYVALEAVRPLTPVTIRCEPDSLGRDQPWYDVPARPMHYILRVGDDLAVAPVSTAQRALAARRVTDAIRSTLFAGTVDHRLEHDRTST